jgi:hypothetical protein
MASLFLKTKEMFLILKNNYFNFSEWFTKKQFPIEVILV